MLARKVNYGRSLATTRRSYHSHYAMVTRSANILVDDFTESLAFARLCLLVQLKSQHHQADILGLLVMGQRPLVKATQHSSLGGFNFLGIDNVGRTVIAHTLKDVCQLGFDVVLRNEDGWDGRGCEIKERKKVS